MGRILTPCFGEGIRPTDEYSPHDLEMVFVHGRILASCCGEGIRPTDETLLDDLEMVFVHGGILASCCGEGIRQKPTNSLVYAMRILWGRINDIIHTSTAAVDYRNSLLVRYSAVRRDPNTTTISYEWRTREHLLLVLLD